MPIDIDRGYIPGLIGPDGQVIVSQPRAGVQTRFTPEGIAVHMYWGEPGRYWGDHGQELPEAMAILARYPVEQMKIARQKAEAMATAARTIEEEYQLGSDRRVIEERGDYTLVEMATDRYNIEFKDGSVINPAPLVRDVAYRVLDQLVSPSEPAVLVAQKKP